MSPKKGDCVIYVISANADFTETGMTTVEQFVRNKALHEGQRVVELFETTDNAEASARYNAWISDRRPNNSLALKIDDVDLRAVMTALGPWWDHLAPFCLEKADA
jgi:hypothetical protein